MDVCQFALTTVPDNDCIAEDIRSARISRRQDLKSKAVVLVLAAILSTGPANAAWEGGLAVAKEIDGESTGIATLSYVTAAQRAPWELMLGYVDGRSHIDSGRVPDTLFAGISRRYNFDRHWYGSFGAVLNDQSSDVLSGHLQFQSALGWHGERLGLSLRHLSNGGFKGRNRGETFVLLQVAF